MMGRAQDTRKHLQGVEPFGKVHPRSGHSVDQMLFERIYSMAQNILKTQRSVATNFTHKRCATIGEYCIAQCARHVATKQLAQRSSGERLLDSTSAAPRAVLIVLSTFSCVRAHLNRAPPRPPPHLGTSLLHLIVQHLGCAPLLPRKLLPQLINRCSPPHPHL